MILGERRDFARITGTICLFIILTGTARGQQSKPVAGKFAPPPGKTLVAIGASWDDDFAAYTKATGHRPQGAKFFCGLNGDGDVGHFNNNARHPNAEGRFLLVEFALDPAFPKESAKDFDKLGPFMRGEKDASIEAMGRAIKAYGKPVFAVLGYEFDGQHPHQASEYAAVFRRIHDSWDRIGVRNVAYVWHSLTDNLNSFDRKANKTEKQLEEYYPGDEYVDWFGVSIYYETQRQGAVRIARIAKAKGKPVGIIETGIGVNPSEFWIYSWDGYYAPLFKYVEQLDVRLISYNNFGDAFNKFSEPGNPFRNTQMDRMPREVQQGWGRMMRTSRFRDAALASGMKLDDRKSSNDGDRKSPSETIPTVNSKLINLLTKLDPKRDAVEGDWKFANKMLAFGGDKEWSRIQVPYHPPEEYDLTVVAERVRGTEILIIGLVVGGQQTTVVLDGWGGGVSGLERIDGKVSQDNETTHRGWRFVNGKPTTIVCKVRKSGVVVSVDGEEIVNWRGEASRLSIVGGWNVPDDKQLFLGAWKGGAFRFRKVEIQEVSSNTGKGIK